ncbi:MAG: acetyl/propionyl/methylcrotonyl-CoA carboxylase subunit alpha [Paracoccaceae bacterium]|nr:acetyl/propionyl/methylcrotonyl-CoA carboxylase subunit alpha [Paracoccaceae bacterium]
MSARPFDTLLIANRGEIACRVIDTARRMGLRAVAVFSDADADALHVAMADEAVRIGPPSPADSYLKIDAILAAARQTGAGAIHPGYGFLSENPEFVEAVEREGLVFVGPSASAIRAMGLKDAAKALMEKAGVPVVPGYHGDDQSPERLADEAGRIGYPVLIKAVAGGGGKGMRIASLPHEFEESLASAQAEARSAFGNDAVLIEKLVEKPRHIEVQVFGDGDHALHLFERDCSLQRRHQKVIEEAPAPGMTDEMRTAMGAAAVRAAEAVGYSGAGTVEFIVDASDGLRPDRFWFMEMNTRLQVEHPVTEAITGVDLVEWQLRVAAGEPLPAPQSDLSITGHSIEARLYAEDAAGGFLPATGCLAHLVFPEGARIDTSVRQGDAITPHYDPMIAKIIVHGADRGEALRDMDRALAATEIAGTETNRAFLARLAACEGFRSGDVDTGLIARELPNLIAEAPPSDAALAIAAVAALGVKQDAVRGFSNWTPLAHPVTLGETALSVAFTPTGASVGIGAKTLAVSQSPAGWMVDGRKAPLKAARIGNAVHVFGAETASWELPDPLACGTGAGQGGLEAPMPGLITDVRIAAGDAVVAGQRLVLLEAMKMEHALTSPRDGRVAEVRVSAGDQVEAGERLLALEPEAAE